MYNFYFHSTPGKRLIDADTGRAVGVFDADGFLSAEAVAAACAEPLIRRALTSYSPYYLIRFTVWDGDAEPIVGAKISVGDNTVLTDEYGCAAIKLQAGSREVTVEAEGYERVSEEMTVTNAPVNATYTLSRMGA